MLDEAFFHSIAEQTKRACQRPISGLFLELYLEQQESLFSERGVRLEVAEEILEGAFGRREFLDASVRISTATLALLDEAELSELKQSFSGAIRGAFSELGEQIPYAYLGAIDPTSPTNILEHERDHLKPIPEAVVARGWMEALSASEPRSLGPHDIKNALAAALRTRDQEFIATIGKRIQERKRHE